MGIKDEWEHVEPANRTEWRRWLRKHHATSPGIWLVFSKGATRGLTYDESVEEALCFGWIDSVVNAIDDRRFKQMFTPRKPTSGWSKTNKVRVERLIANGFMQPAGQAIIDEAKRNGKWTHLDSVEALEVPPDLTKAFRGQAKARKTFEGFPPGARKQILYWINEAKRPETRAKRISAAVEAAARGERANDQRRD